MVAEARDGPFSQARQRRGSSTKFELFSGGRKFDVEVRFEGDALKVAFEGKQFEVQLTSAQGGDALLARIDKNQFRVTLEEETESTLKLEIDGQPITLGRAQVQLHAGVARDEETAPTAAEPDALLSPMFGKVISVEVEVGDSVDPGQPLLVMEAMKMETVLRADRKRRIKEVLVKEGDGVNKGQVLMRFD